MEPQFIGKEPGGGEERRRPGDWLQGASSLIGMKGRWTREETTWVPKRQAGSHSLAVVPTAHPCPVSGTEVPPEHSYRCFSNWTDVEGGVAFIGCFLCTGLPAAWSRAHPARMSDVGTLEFQEHAQMKSAAVRYMM